MRSTTLFSLLTALTIAGCGGPAVEELGSAAQALRHAGVPNCAQVAYRAGQVSVEEIGSRGEVFVRIDGEIVCQDSAEGLADSDLLKGQPSQVLKAGDPTRKVASDPMPAHGRRAAESDPMPANGRHDANSDPMPATDHRNTESGSATGAAPGSTDGDPEPIRLRRI